jgi:hypothetical protein
MTGKYLKNVKFLRHQGNSSPNDTEIPSHPVRMDIIKKTNNKCWQGCGGKGTLNTASGNVN